MLEIKMLFKGLTLNILMCYILPNNKKTAIMIKEHIKNMRKPQLRKSCIIMGDFNSIVNIDLEE